MAAVFDGLFDGKCVLGGPKASKGGSSQLSSGWLLKRSDGKKEGFHFGNVNRRVDPSSERVG